MNVRLTKSSRKAFHVSQAVIRNQPRLCELLIERGCDVNNAGIDKGQKCTPPLHLASKLGYEKVVEVLLDYGGRSDQSRCVCFPRNSHTIYMQPQHVRRKPILHALPQDRVNVVNTLLTHRNSKNVIKSPTVLHEACKARAKKCADLIVHMYAEQVNNHDSENLTPLHYCLKGIEGFHRSGGLQRIRDGKAIAIILLESGAKFAPDAFNLGDRRKDTTFLHVLYDSEDRTDIYRLTRLFLVKGPPDLVTQVTDDSDGDTPLHRLLKSFGRRQTRTVPENSDMYIRETISCIRLLLVRGCDLNFCNRRGENALHALLSHHGTRPVFHLEEEFGYHRGYPQFLFSGICSVAEVLLKMGADPNQLSPPKFVSPLYYLMRVICASSPRMIHEASEEMKSCIRIFCQHGANLHVINSFEENALTLLLASMGRWLNKESNEPYIIELLCFTYDIIKIFLSYGLQPASVLSKNLKQVAIMLWAPLVHEESVKHIIEIIKLVIRSGGNPNTSWPSLYGPDQTKAYSTLYFLSRALVIHSSRQNEFIVDILRVFENTLNHNNWTSLLKLVCGWLNDMKPHSSCAKIIKQVTSRRDAPRALLVLCRMEIYQALDWNIDKECEKLQLPKFLETFLRVIQ